MFPKPILGDITNNLLMIPLYVEALIKNITYIEHSLLAVYQVSVIPSEYFGICRKN